MVYLGTPDTQRRHAYDYTE